MRRARTRGATLLLTLLVVGLVAVFVTSFWISRNASGETGLAFFLLLAALLFIMVYFGNNYWQWRVLQAFDMRCPHCGEALVGHVPLDQTTRLCLSSLRQRRAGHGAAVGRRVTSG